MQINKKDYEKLFSERQYSKDSPNEADTRAGRALTYAMDIRKFEIELYWKRATYFWTFIGAAFAAYALTYRTASEHAPWLLLVFSALGFVFSYAWYLVNRGSKFWQNNWERHVDLLEDMTVGPLYKVIAYDPSRPNPLTSAGEFSVTKINQILSVFVFFIWGILFIKSLWPISPALPIDIFKFAVAVSTAGFVLILFFFGRSSNVSTETALRKRELKYHSVNHNANPIAPSVNQNA